MNTHIQETFFGSLILVFTLLSGLAVARVSTFDFWEGIPACKDAVAATMDNTPLAHSIGRIYARYRGEKGIHVGVATKIGPNLLVTAAHVISRDAGKKVAEEIFFVGGPVAPSPMDLDTMPRLSVSPVAIDFKNSEGKDTALLQISSKSLSAPWFQEFQAAQEIPFTDFSSEFVQKYRGSDLGMMTYLSKSCGGPAGLAVRGLVHTKLAQKSDLGMDSFLNWAVGFDGFGVSKYVGSLIEPGVSGSPIVIRDGNHWVLIGVMAKGSNVEDFIYFSNNVATLIRSTAQ